MKVDFRAWGSYFCLSHHFASGSTTLHQYWRLMGEHRSSGCGTASCAWPLDDHSRFVLFVSLSELLLFFRCLEKRCQLHDSLRFDALLDCLVRCLLGSVHWIFFLTVHIWMVPFLPNTFLKCKIWPDQQPFSSTDWPRVDTTQAHLTLTNYRTKALQNLWSKTVW